MSLLLLLHLVDAAMRLGMVCCALIGDGATRSIDFRVTLEVSEAVDSGTLLEVSDGRR